MTLPPATADHLVAAIRRAAKSDIMPRFRNLASGEIETKSDADDLVTIADKRAEATIANAALDVLPDALIVGEEATETEPRLLSKLPSADLAVVIDPVDGTGNFARGLAVFGVILAVVRDGETILGILYDPIMDDWIIAEKGRGAAFMTSAGARQTLGSGAALPIEEMSGYVSLHLFDGAAQAPLAATFPRFKFVDNLRCSCHEYRMMALGHAHFSLSAMAKPWDHLAGALVLSEIGGGVYSNATRCHTVADFHPPLLCVGSSNPTSLAKLVSVFKTSLA